MADKEQDLEKSFVVISSRMAIIEADSASEAVAKFHSGDADIAEKLDVEPAKVAILRMVKKHANHQELNDITEQIQEFVNSLPGDVEATIIPLGPPRNNEKRNNDKMN